MTTQHYMTTIDATQLQWPERPGFVPLPFAEKEVFEQITGVDFTPT